LESRALPPFQFVERWVKIIPSITDHHSLATECITHNQLKWCFFPLYRVLTPASLWLMEVLAV
jgi:hypothetical protein